MAAPFISRQDLEDITGREVSSDDGATIAVNFACSVVRTFAEQLFTPVVGDSVTLDGTGTDSLLLPELPVTGAGTVTVTTSSTATTYGTADYKLNGDGVLFAGTAIGPLSWSWPNAGVWPAGRQNIEVTYDHGYGTVPEDVRGIALAVAQRYVLQGPASSEQLGEQRITYASASTELNAGERMILGKYRRTR